MSDERARFAESMAVFKLAMKASSKGIHRTLNRPPKGKGWVPCVNAPEGMFLKPDRVRESIELFEKGYAIRPDIVALLQIALAYEMLGEFAAAREYFVRMQEQAVRESNVAYQQAARMGLERTKGA